MSLTGGAATGADAAVSWPRWARANVSAAMTALAAPPRFRAVQGTRARALAAALATILLVALAMAFADGQLATASKQLPGWVHVAFAFMTDFGKSGWFLWPAGVVLAAIAAVTSPALALSRLVLAAIAVRTGFLFAAIAVPSLFATIIKRLIGRARPFVGAEPDPFLYGQLVWRPDYASMPSGHATTAFAAAIAIGLLWPRLRPLMLLYALIIAVSRVVLDAHYLSDVIAGAFVGSIGALMVRDWFARRHLGFVVDAQGVTHALPGPSWARIKRVARGLIAP
jgi:membrane-associated phospholipid phosphatase